jgi:hypothetical protein
MNRSVDIERKNELKDRFANISLTNNQKRISMAIPLDSKQVVSFEELLLSQTIQLEAVTKLLVEKGIFTKEEFLEMVKVVNRERKRGRR